MKITKNLNTYEIEDLYSSCQTDASIRLPVSMSHGGLLVNRPGFSRHLASSLRNAFQTLPATADC